MRHTRIAKTLIAFAAAAGMAFGGVGIAQAAAGGSGSASGSSAYTISNVKVSDITALTPKVTFDWKLNADANYDAAHINNLCFVAVVRHITDITPIEYKGMSTHSWPDDFSGCDTNAGDKTTTSEDEASSSKDVYASSEHEFNLPDDDGNPYLAMKYTGRDFYRYYSDSWDHKSNSGTFTIDLQGLEPNTTYGNTSTELSTNSYCPIENKFIELWNSGKREKTPVDIRQLIVGMQALDVHDTDYMFFTFGETGFVPDFTTAKDDGSNGSVFSDVLSSTPHADDIAWLKEQKITEGYPDGTFAPAGLVNRQDMAAFLHRLAALKDAAEPDGQAKAFTDVNDRTAHAGDIAWLAKAGVTEGYQDGTFGVGGTVLRQDMAAFLHRMNTNVLNK